MFDLHKGLSMIARRVEQAYTPFIKDGRTGAVCGMLNTYHQKLNVSSKPNHIIKIPHAYSNPNPTTLFKHPFSKTAPALKTSIQFTLPLTITTSTAGYP